MAGFEEDEAVVEEYHRSLENFAEQQEKVLERILRKDSECEYLRRHGFRGQTDVKTFKELLPVIEYDAIEQDMERIVEGDTSPILSCEEVRELYVSSGTTSGKRKLIPGSKARGPSKDNHGKYLKAFMSLSSVGKPAGMGMFYWSTGKKDRAPEGQMPCRSSVGKPAGLGMFFWSASKKDRAPGGLPIAQATTFYITSPEYKEFAHNYCSPHEVLLCLDHRQATYCHLLCGLLQSSEVTSIGAVFASGVAHAFNFLKEHWGDICRDIETGELSGLVSDPSVRAAVTKLLTAPNPALADSVRAECSRDSWEGIIPRLWPQARLIPCITTGTMIQYTDYLNFLTSGQLPLSCSPYVGTEGLYGFNPCLLSPPHETFYVLQHNEIIYFEFIRVRGDPEQPQHVGKPEDDNDEEARVVDLAGVKEGEVYEIVVSNGEGLWRYRVGDILQCVGFYHKAPKFKFLSRKNVILSINSDKTDDKELLEVVTKAAEEHLPANARLYDFTSCVSMDSVPGHYVIFWEIGSEGDPIHLGEQVLAEACSTMEAALSEAYRRGRNHGIIAPMELRIVRPGTFDQITAGAWDRGVMQFKLPRGYQAGNPDLAILNAAVVETGRSPRAPPHAALNPAG